MYPKCYKYQQQRCKYALSDQFLHNLISNKLAKPNQIQLISKLRIHERVENQSMCQRLRSCEQFNFMN